MKNKKHTAQSAFFNLRALVGLLVCGAVAFSMLSGVLLAFFRPEAPANHSQTTLTFEQRVGYQRAIEDVYWRHRIWPKDRPDPKPSLDAVMSKGQLERKVTDYLRKSQALEDYWQRPITGEQLQSEMDRMAKHTKQPEVLRELFEALGNDPFVVAECLARPALAGHNPVVIASSNGPRVESWPVRAANTDAVSTLNYTLPTISDGVECIDDTWTPTSITNPPTGRYYHTAVWTGSEMIVWGGSGQGSELNTGRKYNPVVTPIPTPTPPPFLNTGARYNPSTDTWTATSTIGVPSAREVHTAVWTGSEMIMWGGIDQFGYSNTGGRYNPTSDTWLGTSFTNVPSARWGHTAVWTGSEMIVWGGFSTPGDETNTGGRYNPITNSWAATTTTSAPEGREGHTAVWTGSEMIVWGGTIANGITQLNTGGRYNPITDTWIATTLTNVPSARFDHTGVWSGNEMVVWGGVDQNLFNLNTGGKYNPSSDSWTATTITNAPSQRGGHTAIWSGAEMIIWGGTDDSTGGRYNPSSDSWTATSTTNAPAARGSHTAVWTGSEMIVWGGNSGGPPLNTGGRYCAQTASPTPTPTPTASSTPTHTPAARVTPTPRPRPSPAPRP